MAVPRIPGLSGRRRAPLPLFRLLDAATAGQNVATAQPWFPSLGGVTLRENRTYAFEGLLLLSRAAGTTSHTTSVLFGGTATLAAICAHALVNAAQTMGNEADNRTLITVATATVVKAASTTATEQITIRISGILRVVAGGGGTFIPQFQYSVAPGGAPTILANSFFLLTELGDASAVAAGAWA